jgi:16S rRNA (cytosine1402-N4)-methyltransferase
MTYTPAPEPTPFLHRTVMRDEVVAALAPVPAGTVLDATLGGGGHAQGILESRSDVNVLGIDRDPQALAAASDRLADFGERVIVHRGRFDGLRQAMAEHDVEQLSGAVFDLGVSSPQFDHGDRGFSYRHDAPLDMRMDPDDVWSAADIVNGYDEDRLANLLQRHADERWARRIARAIVAARPIETTAQLASVVASAIPAPARRRGGHPAKRTFQALRIEVNRELEVLPAALDDAIAVLAPGGRIAVLAYHSGEDRLVKERFRAGVTGGCTCPDDLPCVCGAVRTLRLVKAPSKPSAAEIAENPRAASARLRVAERLNEAG